MTTWNPNNLPGPRMMCGDLPLSSGQVLPEVQLAYQTYGSLNAAKDNVLWLCHALTGDQYAAGTHPITGKPGWAARLLGPGLPIDTDKFFVICSNVIGGCMGSSGPRSINPETGKIYGLDFPGVTIPDMVAAQARLLDMLGIDKVAAVVGASMGGMQALAWASLFPEKVGAMVAIACSYRHSAQNIAFHEVGRQAVMADPDWQHGQYYQHEALPERGLAVARMTAHITYMSESSLQGRFGRALQDRQQMSYSFDADFQIQSYLRHQGIRFVDRFDANSYLYLTRATDYFDLSADHNGNLARAFKAGPRYCIMALTSDWLYPPQEHKRIVKALNAVAADVSYAEIDTDKGHDGFLHDEPQFEAILSGYLNALV